MTPYQQPDASGHFGPYGGSFVAETLVHALDELKACYDEARRDPAFDAEFRSELAHYVGRPSPIYHAARLSRELGGAQIHLKREDLNHTGAHKINNTIGQAMLARRMGKPRVIAETGAGQHGVATATICARYGLECVVYMGSEDVRRQAPNVYRMNLLGATVVPVESGSKTLKDALNEALRDWVTNVENTFYIIGTVAGPHPYPTMVRDFQRVIGDECLTQMPEMIETSAAGPAARRGDRLRRRRQQRDGHLLSLHRPRRHAPDRRRGGGRGPRDRPPRGVDQRRQPGRAARQPHLPAAGRRRPDHRDALDLGRPRLPRRRPRARLPATTSAAPSTSASPTTRRSPRSIASAAPKASSRRSSRATPSPTRCKLAPTLRPDQHLLVNLSGRGDKDIATVAELDAQGARDEPHRRHLRRAAPSAAARRSIPYVTAGDPHADTTPAIMRAMVEAGADVIELGVPVQRPDGRRPGDPEGERAGAGARHRPDAACWRWCASSAAATAETPIVLMGYANPIERYGVERFVADAQDAGVDGVLVVDYPPEECVDFAAPAARRAASIRSS